MVLTRLPSLVAWWPQNRVRSPVNATSVTAAGTGLITLGDADTGVAVNRTTTIGGTSTGTISMGDATLADGVTLTVGTGADTQIDLDAITGTALGAVSNLTINTTGVVTVAEAVGTDIGTLRVVNGDSQSYQAISAENIRIDASTSFVDFNGSVSVSDSIVVASSGQIIQDAPVVSAENLSYSADRIDLGADITTVGYGSPSLDSRYQSYTGTIYLKTDVTLTGDTSTMTGPFITNGNRLVLAFNAPQPQILPPYTSYSDAVTGYRQLSPDTLLASSVEFSESLLSYYSSQLPVGDAVVVDSQNIQLGGENVIRINEDSICVDSTCSEEISVDSVDINPSPTASLPNYSLGEVSRNFVPVIPIF
jgi:hypothetical protein